MIRECTSITHTHTAWAESSVYTLLEDADPVDFDSYACPLPTYLL
eukprot:SAG25_NODE_6972_length_514_cov_1.836145_1_plen_44_part_10